MGSPPAREGRAVDAEGVRHLRGHSRVGELNGGNAAQEGVVGLPGVGGAAADEDGATLFVLAPR
jgi:hypothetical protein